MPGGMPRTPISNADFLRPPGRSLGEINTSRQPKTGEYPVKESDLILDYAPRRQFVPFHQRSERFAS
jgi:hypothetical protein